MLLRQKKANIFAARDLVFKNAISSSFKLTWCYCFLGFPEKNKYIFAL